MLFRSQDQIEKILADSAKTPRFVAEHLEQCTECREEVAAMRQHSDMMHELRPPSGMTIEPRPGFYARVMERIEAEGPISIWNIFIESTFGRRIAYASVALALVLGVYLVSSERSEEPIVSEQTVGQPAAADAAFQGDATEVLSAVPASSVQMGGAPVAGDDLAAQMMLQQRMMMQQQMMMQEMINQMNNAGSQDQVLVNLATYQEQ